MSKILFVYAGGRRERLKEFYEEGKSIPMEFMYGFPQLKSRGYDVDFLEEPELIGNRNSLKFKLHHSINDFFLKYFFVSTRTHHFVNSIDKLKGYDVVIGVGDTTAMALSYFRLKRKIDGKIVYFAMGMMERLRCLKSKYPSLFRLISFYHRKLIRNCDMLVFLGEGEFGFYKKQFPESTNIAKCLPFGIDTSFWKPDRNKGFNGAGFMKSDVLFVGNDLNRDFDLLIEIANKMRHLNFIFITRRVDKKKVSENVQLIQGKWNDITISDKVLRNIYINTRLVINPLLENIQPSGQSVTLQAMACGKPVMISRTEGFWEPDTFSHNTHLFFIEGRCADVWCRTIDNVIGNQQLMDRVAQNGYKLVSEKCSLEKFSEGIEDLIKKL